jgi:hypothetical protein
MTDHLVADTDPVRVVASMEDRLRAMHVTLLFIAVALALMVGINIMLLVE